MTRKIIERVKATAAARWRRQRPTGYSQEPRGALNSAVAGRRWTGQLFQPTPHANARAWGFGFIPPVAQLDSLALPLGRHCFGQKIRLRIWRCSRLQPTDPFRLPGGSGDQLVFDRQFLAVAAVQGEPIAQLCRVDVSDVTRWAPCLHLIELSFSEEPRSPLAVGRSSDGGPWTWECGWVQLRGRPALPLARPWGIAWTAYGPEDEERSWRSCDGDVDVMGEAEARGFSISMPKVAVSQTSNTVVSPPTEFQVPAPGWRAGLDAGSASRYDLVSIHRDTGHLALTLGTERDLDPEEFPAVVPPQHLPLYSLYTTGSGVEPIPVFGWHDMVREDRRADHAWWLENSRHALKQTFRKLRRGGTFRLAGYGDSLTSLGGRDPSMIEAPNGPFRDNLGYFELYGEDWKRSVELFRPAEGGPRRQQRLGWNWYLKAAMESAYDVSVDYLNWGIPGTTTEANRKNIGGGLYPNGSEPQRLKRLLESTPDLVTVCFGMNEIGDAVDTYANMLRMIDAIRAGGADVLVVGLSQQNADFGSRDHALWRLTHDQIATAAADSKVANLPTWEIFGDGNEGATGLSRRSHSAATRTNHPGARELAAIGSHMAKIII